MSPGRAWRLWRAGGLQVPRKRPRQRIASGRPRAPSGANQVWTLDFVFDRCANGQQLKCPTMADEWTREGLAIEVAGSIRSGRVIEALSRLGESAARPAVCAPTPALSSSPARCRGIEEMGIETRVDQSRQALAKRSGRELQRLPGSARSASGTSA